jgi:hypothetical protein
MLGARGPCSELRPVLKWTIDFATITPGAGRPRPLGVLRSVLRERSAARRQGSEGAPGAWIELEPWASVGLLGLAAGEHLALSAAAGPPGHRAAGDERRAPSVRPDPR